MTTNILSMGSFSRLNRSPMMTSGLVFGVDPTIKSYLDELNAILGRRIFNPAVPGQEIEELLKRRLTSKWVPGKPGNEWDNQSLVFNFNTAQVDKDFLTLSEYIDKTADLCTLKYAFQNNAPAILVNMNFNTRTVLNNAYAAIIDYLIGYAVLVMKVQDLNGLLNFIQSNPAGAKNVANYAVVSAVRTIVDKNKFHIPEINTDGDEIVGKIISAGFPLATVSFEPAVKAFINDYLTNSTEYEIIEHYKKKDEIPPGIEPLLIKYMKASKVTGVTITKANSIYYIPLFISQIMQTTVLPEPTEIDAVESDKDFEVQFLEDDVDLIQISQSAIKCAAQLYYAMVLGDELNIFETMDYFTHKYLVRGGIEIKNRYLRDDLQMYVFSNRFTDLKTKQFIDRTRSAERQMFYRQVFDYGNAQVTDDLIVNQEFPRLWKVLMLESAQYIDRAQASPDPSYVSRQNVMQAVEDLQYNLSTHCTGMANVITPLIYAELNFIMQRIFKNHEIMGQIVPAGGTWWRVVENLYMGMRNSRPKTKILDNKARRGYAIIRSLADFNPATFEDDQNFFPFIYNVNAFITAESILQGTPTDDLNKGDTDASGEPNSHRMPGPDFGHGMPAPVAKSGTDEWDF